MLSRDVKSTKVGPRLVAGVLIEPNYSQGKCRVASIRSMEMTISDECAQLFARTFARLVDIPCLWHVHLYGVREQDLSNISIARQSENTSLYVVLVAASAAISGLLFGYDTAVINGALVYLRLDFKLSPFETEQVASVLLWGCAIGAALAGFLSDRYGRRAVLFIAGVLFCISALGAAFPTQLWQLLLARVLDRKSTRLNSSHLGI